MPGRIIREGLLHSERIDLLTAEEERFFGRLMLVLDDYGRSEARVSFLRSKCFPSKPESEVSSADVADWLSALQAVDLLMLYQVSGKLYVQVHDTRWQHRSASRCPEPTTENTLGMLTPEAIEELSHSKYVISKRSTDDAQVSGFRSTADHLDRSRSRSRSRSFSVDAPRHEEAPSGPAQAAPAKTVPSPQVPGPERPQAEHGPAEAQGQAALPLGGTETPVPAPVRTGEAERAFLSDFRERFRKPDSDYDRGARFQFRAALKKHGLPRLRQAIEGAATHAWNVSNRGLGWMVSPDGIADGLARFDERTRGPAPPGARTQAFAADAERGVGGDFGPAPPAGAPP